MLSVCVCSMYVKYLNKSRVKVSMFACLRLRLLKLNVEGELICVWFSSKENHVQENDRKDCFHTIVLSIWSTTQGFLKNLFKDFTAHRLDSSGSALSWKEYTQRVQTPPTQLNSL